MLEVSCDVRSWRVCHPVPTEETSSPSSCVVNSQGHSHHLQQAGAEAGGRGGSERPHLLALQSLGTSKARQRAMGSMCRPLMNSVGFLLSLTV